ncbi:cobalamin biosynthesis family protein [Vibrio proteolyticus]|uniref:Cobalamin biosynthesis protein CobD n=1 Tax=Vibrio proteolyticus NBRC 13287 TaxID=1219065 RepID=U3BD60_VIBPR|nr:cobalamin biosynthesis family protein [Vibrio proteolyticus]GAD67694.1 cobalamin biosynthesis protein CobD [Vibrio proteolyticus NBRC 13287]
MEDLFNSLYSNGALLVMWGALLCHYLLPIPRDAHPANLWRRFAHLLADKVNTPHSHTQSVISGSLALLLMLLPTWLVLWALKPLVWQPQLYELALLILALDWRSYDKLTHELLPALAKDEKAQARSTLQPFLNRETRTLSALGLGKAGAETLILGYGRNVVGVLFWYALGGGAGALLYRLAVELARAWSPSRATFSPFGLPAIRLVAVLDFVPLRLLALLVVPGQRGLSTFQTMRAQSVSWPLPGPGWLLTSLGSKLELALGGPAIYDGRKAVRAKIGGRIAPAAIHLAQLQKFIAWRILIWIVTESVILAIIYQGF